MVENGISDPWRGNLAAYPWQSAGVVVLDSQNERGLVHSNGAFNRSDVNHTLIGGEFVHTINSNTFYTVTGQYLMTEYRTPFADLRDGSFVDEDGNFVTNLGTRNGVTLDQSLVDQYGICFGGSSDLNGDGESIPYCVGQEPFNFAGSGGNAFGVQLSTGGHWNKARDNSDVGIFTGRFDLTSQLNRFMQVKTGAEIIASDYDMDYNEVTLGLSGAEPGFYTSVAA